MDVFKQALPEIGQRLVLPIFLFVVALGGLWLSGETHEWEFGRAAVATLAAVAVLWLLDPLLQLIIHDGEEADPDGDVA